MIMDVDSTFFSSSGDYLVNNSHHGSSYSDGFGYCSANNNSNAYNYNLIDNVNNHKNINSSRPLTCREMRIKSRIEQWRQNMAWKLGHSPSQENYNYQNSVIIHDIFIESIARSAEQIKSYDDFYRVAYYWKLIDLYGPEVFDIIRDELHVSKRQRRDYEDTRKRVRCH